MTAAPSSESGTVAARASGDRAKTPLDLNETVQATVAAARAQWHTHSEFELALEPGLPLVPAEAITIEHAIRLMIGDAARATRGVLGESGTKGTIAISTAQRGDTAEIKVTDNGPGLRSHGVARDDAHGSDELAAIVSRHEGNIEFETEPGVGSTITISLPLHIEEERP